MIKTKIGADEARTRLPELLRQVRTGKRFTITYRGRAIADLVPAKVTRSPNAAAAIERFQAFMRDNPVTLGNVCIRDLNPEGRG